jgi:hypothetical protein
MEPIMIVSVRPSEAVEDMSRALAAALGRQAAPIASDAESDIRYGTFDAAAQTNDKSSFRVIAVVRGSAGELHELPELAQALAREHDPIVVHHWALLDPDSEDLPFEFDRMCAPARVDWVVRSNAPEWCTEWAAILARELTSARAEGPDARGSQVPSISDLALEETPGPIPPPAPNPTPSLTPVGQTPSEPIQTSAGPVRLGFPGQVDKRDARYTYVFDSEEILAMSGEAKLEGPSIQPGMPSARSESVNPSVVLPSSPIPRIRRRPWWPWILAAAAAGAVAASFLAFE